jgi:hypothetical protein
MLRNILAIVAALIAGCVAILVIEITGHQLYPPPGNIDLNNEEALKTYFSNAPAVIFLFIILAYAVGSFISGLVASLIAAHNKLKKALTLGWILMGFSIYNLITIPHPVWVVICGILVFIPFAYIGGKLGIRFTAPKPQ